MKPTKKKNGNEIQAISCHTILMDPVFAVHTKLNLGGNIILYVVVLGEE